MEQATWCFGSQEIFHFAFTHTFICIVFMLIVKNEWREVKRSRWKGKFLQGLRVGEHFEGVNVVLFEIYTSLVKYLI